MERRPIIPTPAGSLLLALFRLAVLFVSPVATSFTNDFSGYPSGAQACLYDAADQSGCQGDTSQAMNACLCGGDGGGFVTTAGACIGADDAGDLRSTWEIMSSHCQDSGTPLSVSEDDFLALAPSNPPSSSTTTTTTTTQAPTTTTSTQQTATPTTTPAPSSSDADTGEEQQQQGGGGGGGLSTGARTGVIVGAVAAAVLLLLALALVFCFLRRRKKKQQRRQQYEQVEHLHLMQSCSSHHHPSPSTTTFANAANAAPSELESSSSTTLSATWAGSHTPWSPSTIATTTSQELDAQQGGKKLGAFRPVGKPAQQPPTTTYYEMSADNEVPAPPHTTSTSMVRAEMPTISVTSPTVSPATTSPHMGSWDAELAMGDENEGRYEPYRPRYTT